MERESLSLSLLTNLGKSEVLSLAKSLLNHIKLPLRFWVSPGDDFSISRSVLKKKNERRRNSYRKKRTACWPQCSSSTSLAPYSWKIRSRWLLAVFSNSDCAHSSAVLAWSRSPYSCVETPLVNSILPSKLYRRPLNLLVISPRKSIKMFRPLRAMHPLVPWRGQICHFLMSEGQNWHTHLV